MDINIALTLINRAMKEKNLSWEDAYKLQLKREVSMETCPNCRETIRAEYRAVWDTVKGESK